MKRILMLMNSFNVGGVTNVVLAIYNGLDKEKYSIDFIRDARYQENEIEKSIKDNGSEVFYFNKPRISKIPLLNYRIQHKKMVKELLAQIGKVKYDVIHIHAHASVGIYIARKLKIPVRILHFHEAIPDFGENVNKSKLTSFMWKKRRKFYNKWATVKAGDSLRACKVKYGERVVNDPKLKVLYPPIDMDRFNPNIYDKNNVIKEFSVNTEAFNLIHVGRLTPVKNQKFIIDILKEINNERLAELYFVGDGESKKQLIEHAEKLGLTNKVKFLPPNTSPAIYKCMDSSILPSFSEAFGMVAVESQLMGVKCFASTNVPTDVDIGGCEFLPLSLGAKIWAERILVNQDNNFNFINKNKFNKQTLLDEVEGLYNE